MDSEKLPFEVSDDYLSVYGNFLQSKDFDKRGTLKE